MKTVGRIIGAALLALVAAALVFAVLMFAGVLPWRAYVVESDSMAPGIPTGAMVIVDTNASIEDGDVISFWTGDTVVTHRLLETNADGTLVTKGDNMQQVDPFVATSEDIIGEVTKTIPGAGPVIAFLTSPVGFLSVAMVVIGIALLAALFTKRDSD